MAETPQAGKPKPEFKRLNRAVGAGEALGRVLDPALKKRGFASRDLITHWGAMAPAPYDKVALPDKLTWPRGAGAEGATLYLRCAPGHALALAHEGQTIASAINRYFGYFLVGAVRMSLEPFSPAVEPVREAQLPPAASETVSRAIEGIGDEGLRDALARLGSGLWRKSGR